MNCKWVQADARGLSPPSPQAHFIHSSKSNLTIDGILDQLAVILFCLSEVWVKTWRSRSIAVGTHPDGEVQVGVDIDLVKIALKGRLPLLHMGFVSRGGE
jgi:hypothetical protein